MQFHTRLVIRFMRAVSRHAHVAGGDALHAAILVKQDFGGGKARENLYAHLFGLACEPTAEVPERSGIGALIVHESGRKQMGHRRLARRAQHPVMIFRDRALAQQAGAVLAPVGKQLVQRLGIDHRTGKDMRADFRSLFQDADAQFVPGLAGQLLQADGGRQARGASPDDNHVINHRLPFGHSLSPLGAVGTLLVANSHLDGR